MGMEMSSIEEMLKEGATLTLEPETAPELPVEEAKPIPKVYEEEQYLTDDEKKQVESFVKQIRLDDSNAILQYGSGTQKKMSAFSEGTLEKVRSKDLGEVGELLNGVVVELKGFDEEEEKGIKGFFKKKISKAQTLVYGSVTSAPVSITTRSPCRSEGCRGVGRPPSCSGHTGTSSWRSASFSTHDWGLDAPSYRQGIPSKHAEISSFMSSSSHGPAFPFQFLIQPSRRPISVGRRQHGFQAHDPRPVQRCQQIVQFPLQSAENHHLAAHRQTGAPGSLSLRQCRQRQPAAFPRDRDRFGVKPPGNARRRQDLRQGVKSEKQDLFHKLIAFPFNTALSSRSPA